jgi:hypothetical protein
MLACATMIPRTPPFRTLAAMAAIGMAAALPAVAGATTGIEVTVPVQVTLGDAGVKFDKVLKPTTDTTLEIRVTNRSTRARSFRIGDRETHRLRKGQSEFLYFSFRLIGNVPWRSQATGGKLFSGKFAVKLADRFGIPQA